jgi:hypothetical protein
LGCGSNRLPTAPVEGKVLCDGKPLEFGGVLFQSDLGPPALGAIQPDGTFRLSTYRDGDGAVLGTHRVQISCYDVQHPDADAIRRRETGVGKSLIPQKYTRYDSSGLAVEVRAHNEPVLLQLRTK